MSICLRTYDGRSLGSPDQISGGGGLEFLPGHFYLFHKGDGKLYFVSPQDRLYTHHALRPFIDFTHFPTRIFI